MAYKQWETQHYPHRALNELPPQLEIEAAVQQQAPPIYLTVEDLASERSDYLGDDGLGEDECPG